MNTLLEPVYTSKIGVRPRHPMPMPTSLARAAGEPPTSTDTQPAAMIAPPVTGDTSGRGGSAGTGCACPVPATTEPSDAAGNPGMSLARPEVATANPASSISNGAATTPKHAFTPWLISPSVP